MAIVLGKQLQFHCFEAATAVWLGVCIWNIRYLATTILAVEQYVLRQIILSGSLSGAQLNFLNTAAEMLAAPSAVLLYCCTSRLGSQAQDCAQHIYNGFNLGYSPLMTDASFTLNKVELDLVYPVNVEGPNSD